MQGWDRAVRLEGIEMQEGERDPLECITHDAAHRAAPIWTRGWIPAYRGQSTLSLQPRRRAQGATTTVSGKATAVDGSDDAESTCESDVQTAAMLSLALSNLVAPGWSTTTTDTEPSRPLMRPPRFTGAKFTSVSALERP